MASLPPGIPRERSQGSACKGRSDQESTHKGGAWGCHLPVTVSPIMAGGAENVHLNEVVLQCP